VLKDVSGSACRENSPIVVSAEAGTKGVKSIIAQIPGQAGNDELRYLYYIGNKRWLLAGLRGWHLPAAA
jgi:hypothetical protein